MACYCATGAVLLLACILLPFCAAQASCRGRCGEPFARGRVCHCDYTCLVHNECCSDFESKCTTSDSCVGRCGEGFKRGRLCDCDSDCTLYNQCCPDYQSQCRPGVSSQKPMKNPDLKLVASSPTPPVSKSEELYSERLKGQFMSTPSPTPHQNEEQGGEIVAIPMETQPALLLPKSADGHDSTQALVHATFPDVAAHALDTAVPVVPAVAVIVTDGDQQVVQSALGVDHLSPDTMTPSSGRPATLSLELSISGSRQAGGPARPSTLTDVADVLASSSPDDSLTNGTDTADLCSDQPISGVTVLLNGTMVVFRGHFFWTLDVNRTPSAAQRITEVWGVPSPIDTIFTRSNCQGKTYIFKGNNYWSFENGIMDAGCPKSISMEFNGLSGKIVAVLSVPATRRRPEMLYFFKKGGFVQKYSYEPGSTPTCGKKIPIFTPEQNAGDSVITLGNEINIKVTWKGFPSPVFAAVSVPNARKSEGYDYCVFSNDKYYNIKVVGERLALASTPPRAPQNSVRHWLRCL